MAPLPEDVSIESFQLDPRTAFMSPEELSSYLSSLSLAEREAITNPPMSHPLSKRDDAALSLSPISAHFQLTARNTAQPPFDPSAGTIPPDAFNNKGIQALFALIGASFVLGSIWFFFWAKNGGFQWRKGDWEEYKSTVLRRKGPNGTTLSNATKSTRLGGGSVVGDGYSDGTIGEAMTDLSSEAPIINEKRKAKKGKAGKSQKKETAKEQKLRETKEARWEGGADNDVRAYRHERVARVGGINRDSDAQFYGADYSETEPSVAHQPKPRTQHHASNIRHVSPEKKANGRREFSNGQRPRFASPPQSGPQPSRYHSPSQDPTASMPGSYAEPLDFNAPNQNNRSYQHPIPGLSGGANNHRAGGGGFRRGGRDSLDESD